ncbi:hypothetical protein PENSPDRAFT_752803 [Peniophora sp. CONT]|nr:hypothetical protein PENSPDRAFT_752803 [Peniophora sp. CONT]
MSRPHEHRHTLQTCLPVRLHATVHYTPSRLPSSSSLPQSFRALNLPPPSDKNIYPDTDEDGREVVMAVWHTWADSDFTSVLVGKVRSLGRDVEVMRKEGVESVVLHKLRKELTVPLPGATPLARASIYSQPSRSPAPTPALASLASPSPASSSSTPFTAMMPQAAAPTCSTTITSPSPAPALANLITFTSPSPAPESVTAGSSESGTDSDDDDDLQLIYPDSEDEENKDEDICMDAPSKSLVDYPPSPICPEPQKSQNAIANGSSVEDENARLREQLEYARQEAEAYREQKRLLEERCLLLRQRLHAAQSKVAAPTQEVVVPSLLEALMMVSKMADEAMCDDA